MALVVIGHISMILIRNRKEMAPNSPGSYFNGLDKEMSQSSHRSHFNDFDKES